MVRFFILLFLSFFPNLLAYTQLAHAHNDYEQARPLYEALENKFNSIEADVYVINGQLMVSHNWPNPNAKSLIDLYLTPLKTIFTQNEKTFVYPKSQPLVLMIDIKNEGNIAYQALKSALNQVQLLDSTASLQIIISGDLPFNEILQDNLPNIGIDGRPTDLGKGYTTLQMPWISQAYKAVCATEKLNRTCLNIIKKLSKETHKESKLLRLWAIPDYPKAWRKLTKAGVDIVNTDNIAGLRLFLDRK